MGERDPERRDRVAKRLHPEVLEQIETGVKTAWIPIEQDAQFVDAILDVYGIEDGMELWRAYTRRFVETGLMKAFIDGTVRIFGLSLASLSRVVPRAWQQSYRGCGEGKVTVQEGRKAAIVEFTGMHPEQMKREGYFILLRGLILGLHDIVGAKDQLDVAIDRGERSYTLILRW